MTDQSRQRQRIIKGIVRGEIAVQEGRIFSQEDARKKLSRWLDDGKTEVS